MTGIQERIAYLMQVKGASAAAGEFKKVGKAADDALGDVDKKAGKAGTAAGSKAAAGMQTSFKKGLGNLGFFDPKVLGAAAIGGAVKFAINAASDLQESMSKSDAVFKGNAKEVQAWAATASSAFGQSKAQALEAAGTFGNLFQAFGVGLAPATEMSTTLTELASDLASFNNTSVQDAIEALRSGLSGETEPLKRYGVALTDARLKQEALGLGLIRDVKGPLDAATKSQAAYSLIMKDTALAQGDFQRTSGGFANSMKSLQASVTDAAATLGEQLLPDLAKLAGYAKTGIDIAVRISNPEMKLTGNKDVDATIRQWVGQIEKQVNPAAWVGDMAGKAQDVFASFGLGASRAQEKAAAAAKAHADEMNRLSREYASATGGVRGYSQQMAQQAAVTRQSTTATQMIADSIREQGDAIRSANDALREQTNLQLAAIDAEFAVTNATNQFIAANQAATTAVDDASTAVNEQQMAFDAATQEARATAAATLALAQQQAALEGSTLSAKQEQDILIGTLMKLASQSSGPVAAAIGVVITKLQETGKQNPKPTVDVNDQATSKIQGIDGLLDGISGRYVEATVNVLTGGAAAALERINNAFARLPRNFNGGIPQGASGFQNFAGGLAIVGEKGPELVNLPKGSDVFTAQETRGFFSGSGATLPTMRDSSGAPIYNMYVTALDPISAAREIKKVLAQGARVGVS